jgi:hypothetical protein
MKRIPEILRVILSEPSSRGLDLDDPNLTEVRRKILREKKFLHSIYAEWYDLLLTHVPKGSGPILEIGSGSGFARDTFPQLITSEVFWLPDITLVTDGCMLPFSNESLNAIVMTDVLHHIPCVRDFFSEASRCLKISGSVVMVEPWVNAWSTFIYRNFHHEGFAPDAAAWEFDSSGPLSGANGALPWIIFDRDRPEFLNEFPCLSVELITQMMPFSYLLSGGLSSRSLLPGFLYPFCRLVERCFDPWQAQLGMFALICLRKTKHLIY